MPRCSQRVTPLTGDRQGIPTNTPDQFPTHAEGLGGPYGTRGTPALYGAMWASNLALDHLNKIVCQVGASEAPNFLRALRARWHPHKSTALLGELSHVFFWDHNRVLCTPSLKSRLRVALEFTVQDPVQYTNCPSDRA